MLAFIYCSYCFYNKNLLFKMTNIYYLLCISLLCLISSHEMTQHDSLSYNHIKDYTRKIMVVKGKTNRTRCIARRAIHANETIFAYNESDVISSESSEFPQKDDVYRFINELTQDSLMKNKIIVTLYILYAMSDKSNNLNQYLTSIPLDSYKNSFINWNQKDIDDYSLTGRVKNLPFDEVKQLKEIYHYLSGNFTLHLKTEKVFIYLYYYVTDNSFISREDDEDVVIMLPYINICNVYPDYMKNRYAEKDYKNDTITFEKNDTMYYIKVTREYISNQHFYFYYNTSYLTNEHTITREGYIAKENFYNEYELKYDMHFHSPKDIDFFINYMKWKVINITKMIYKKDLSTNTLTLLWNIKDPNRNNDLFRLVLGYQEWYNTQFKVRSYFTKKFIKTVLITQKILYDQSEMIVKKMKRIDNYIKEIEKNEEKKNKINNLIHLYNLENLNFLNRHQNNYYSSSVLSIWKEIKNYLLKYTNL